MTEDNRIEAALEALKTNRKLGGTAKTDADKVNRIEDMVSGVSATWLANAFRMDRSVVIRKLANCPEIRVQGDKRNSKLYDLPTAARFLVPPALSADDFLQSLHRSDLPPALQDAVWSALLKRQQWEKNAAQLWSTDDVWRVLSGLFQSIKFTTQLWVDTIDAEAGMTEAQRAVLQRLTRALLQEMYDKIVENARDGTTGSQLAQIEDLVGGDPVMPVEDDEDESEDLI